MIEIDKPYTKKGVRYIKVTIVSFFSSFAKVRESSSLELLGAIPNDLLTSNKIDRRLPKVGDSIEIAKDNIRTFDKEKINAHNSKTLKHFKQQKDLEEKIHGQITSRLDNGYTVEVSGINAYLPDSHIDLTKSRRVKIGRKYDFSIFKLNAKAPLVTVSFLNYMDHNLEPEKLEQGDIVLGHIERISNEGILVNLGTGYPKGIINKKKLSNESYGYLTKFFILKNKIEVTVTNFSVDSKFVTLDFALPQLIDPWEDIEDRYSIGDHVNGNIKSTSKKGYLVQIEEGVEGNLALSNFHLTDKSIRTIDLRLALADVPIRTIILDIDTNKRSFTLGVEQPKPDFWDSFSNDTKIGDIIEGVVRSGNDFGPIIKLTDHIHGHMPYSLSFLPTKKNNFINLLNYEFTAEKASNLYSESIAELNFGDKIKVIVLHIEAKEKNIILGYPPFQDRFLKLENHAEKYGKLFNIKTKSYSHNNLSKVPIYNKNKSWMDVAITEIVSIKINLLNEIESSLFEKILDEFSSSKLFLQYIYSDADIKCSSETLGIMCIHKNSGAIRSFGKCFSYHASGITLKPKYLDLIDPDNDCNLINETKEVVERFETDCYVFGVRI